MIRITFGNLILLDGAEFVSYFEKHSTNFDQKLTTKMMTAEIANDGNLKFFGYSINCKSTVFGEADNLEMATILNGILKNGDGNIIRAFFNFELFNYHIIVNGGNGYLFPFMDLLKFAHWYQRSLGLSNLGNRLKTIYSEILAKAKLTLPNANTESRNVLRQNPNFQKNLLDLIDSVNNFSNELMFACLCQAAKHEISTKGKHDFVVDGEAAEAKTIHDKVLLDQLDLPKGYLQKSLPPLFSLDDLLKEICNQIKRKKWIKHLKCAIEKQKGKLLFFNVTHSPELYNVLIFLEEKTKKRTFEEIINDALKLSNESNLIPVVVMLEGIHLSHIQHCFMLSIPVKDKLTIPKIDFAEYDKCLKENIII